jgi:hypothetical protein
MWKDLYNENYETLKKVPEDQIHLHELEELML